MHQPNRFEELLDGYLAGTLSEREVKQFLTLLEIEKPTLHTAIDQWLANNSFSGLADPDREEALFQQVMQAAAERPAIIRPVRWSWHRIAAAAVLILTLMAGYWTWHHRNQKDIAHKPPLSDEKTGEVLPGGNKAVLTLGDGTRVLLDSAQGAIAGESGIKVLNGNGQLSYGDAGYKGEALYHTVSTPKGGQYQLLLADGSKVWLNAASSIRFPATFTGSHRVVEISGEAYFEVAHNPGKPFIVSVGEMQVEVLGTHFNVHAYPGEGQTKTTLLEGKVRLSSGGSIAILKPGQQARVADAGGISLLQRVYLEEVVAWKNGLFLFNEADVTTIMPQLARWYDVEVQYQGAVPKQKFSGLMSRSSTLREVLDILRTSGLRIILEDKTIIVLPD